VGDFTKHLDGPAFSILGDVVYWWFMLYYFCTLYSFRCLHICISTQL